MKKLPKLRVIPESEHQRSRLKQWLFEWSTDLALRDGILLSEGEPELNSKVITFPGDLPVNESGRVLTVEPAQIRLLRPNTNATAALPRYVAVIQEWEDNSVLVAPFSRFAEPATQGELETERKTPCLRVLSLWNTHSASRSLLQDSWLTDTLSDEELSDAWAVFKSCSTGAELPACLKTRVGPPIVHPEDPRLVYQEEEAIWMTQWQEAAKTLHLATRATKDKNNVIKLPWAGDFLNDTYLAMAADDLSYKGKSSMYEVTGTGALLEIAVHSNEEECTISVFDQKGELSDKLIGCCIFAAQQPENSIILESSRAVVKNDMLFNGFGILDIERNPLSLKEISE